MNAIFWLILCIVLIVFEVVTIQLVSIWFAISAAISFFAALFGASMNVQIILFIVVSIILLCVTKPFTTKLLKRKMVHTNADSLIGKVAKVTDPIDNKNGFGSAIINGQTWTAISLDDNATIDVGKLVVIRQISGVKLIVEEIQNKNQEGEQVC